MVRENENMMNVTYLIGNGFDVHLGMKTEFKNICNAYLKENSDDDIIKNFKSELKNDAPNYKNWSDFEIAMGEYSMSFKCFEDFKKCVSDFRRFMVLYLKNEQQKYFELLNSFQINPIIYSKFVKNICDSIYLSPKNAVNENMKARGKINENFISFNYTTVLDAIVNKANIPTTSGTYHFSSVTHIHGTLDDNIMFGVDNEDQIKNIQFTGNKKLQRLFIKPILNNETEFNKVEQVEKAISNSDVICVYGMSFGESDLTWKKLILNWLKEASHHTLVYFFFNDLRFEKWEIDDILNTEDDFKITVLERMGCKDNYEQLMEQIIIPVNEDIMNFTDYVIKNCSANESFKNRPKENGMS